jgi:hypothetical protein
MPLLKLNRLMLFGETAAVLVRTIRNTDTVHTSQKTQHVSTTKPDRLMLFGETVAVYCENHTEHTDKPASGRMVITLPPAMVALCCDVLGH